jgi:hypothetical protein
MASESQEEGAPSRRSDSGRTVGGIVLVVVGLLALASQLIPSNTIGMYVLPALGVVFLVWGAVIRRIGPLIPGGILLGIGAGALLSEGPFRSMGDQEQGGAFLLVFAAGWVVITLASALFTDRTRLWPLIVAAILAVFGLGALVAGPAFETIASSGWLWSVVLIAVGLYLLFFRRAAR